ncbi:MAG: hypothetical protein ACTSQQ_17435 [Candidatus Helarchaeota archaeon]
MMNSTLAALDVNHFRFDGLLVAVFQTNCIFIQNSAITPYFNIYVGLLQKFTSRISFESIERMSQM